MNNKKPILEQLGNLGFTGYLALALILRAAVSIVRIIFSKKSWFAIIMAPIMANSAVLNESEVKMYTIEIYSDKNGYSALKEHIKVLRNSKNKDNTIKINKIR